MSITITPVPHGDLQFINSYKSGEFYVARERYAHAILVFPRFTRSWMPHSTKEFGIEDFDLVVGHEPIPEILLIGSENNLARDQTALRTELRNLGIGLELMDVGSACRTFNVLLSEGRNVIVGLIPPI